MSLVINKGIWLRIIEFTTIIFNLERTLHAQVVRVEDARYRVQD